MIKYFIYIYGEEREKTQNNVTNSQYVKAKRVKGVGIYYLSSRA